MDKNEKKDLINNLKRLTDSNEKLAEAHHKALTIADRSSKERDRLATICRGIYEVLEKKKDKSLLEESFSIGLIKVLLK